MLIPLKETFTKMEVYLKPTVYHRCEKVSQTWTFLKPPLAAVTAKQPISGQGLCM